MRLLVNGMPAMGAYTGVGYYTWHLLQGLAGRPEVEALGVFNGWDVVDWRAFAARVLAGETDDPPGGASLRQLARTLLPPVRRAWARMRAGAFRRACAGGGWSLYHEPNYIAQPFAGPLVVTVHDLSFLRTPEYLPRDRLGWLRENFRASVTRADRIVVNSGFTLGEVLAHCPELEPARLRVTPLGVDERFFAAGAAPPPETLARDLRLPPRFVLFVGTLEPRKNLQGLLRAHALLPEALQRELPLVITGGRGWRQRYFWRRLQQQRLRGTVRTLGYVPHALVPPLMRAATALCYPSHYEGFGLCPLQAAACGTPVLAADIPPLRETLHEAAVFADPDDPVAIAHGLRRLAEDGKLRERLAALGRERAAQFTWERCVERTVGVYRELS